MTISRFAKSSSKICRLSIIHPDYLFSFLVMDFDAPVEEIGAISRRIKTDRDLIRRVIMRKSFEAGRPCNDVDCDFGELTDENRERNKKHREKYMQYL